METKGIKVVEESEYGLYVWQMPDGKWVGDTDGNFMNIPARKGDLKAMSAISKAARYYGVEEGGPVFVSNRRRVTDDEYDHQRERLANGLLADEYDYAALEDEAKNK